MCNKCSPNCVQNLSSSEKDAIRRHYVCAYNGVQTRQYLQFGSLVFDGKRTVEAYSSTFKNEVSSFLGKHGGVATGCKPLLEATSLSISVEFAFIKMNNLQKQEYSNYIKRGLIGINRLWAVDTGGQLVWTWAKVTSVSENIDKPNNVKSMAIEFSIPSGVWYIADLSKVYVEPYTRCDDQLVSCGCQAMCLDDPFANCKPSTECTTNCDECHELVCELCDDNLFCNTNLDLYWTCQAEYRLIYNCQSTDPCDIFRNFGYALTQNKTTMIVGTFCSNTVLEGSTAVTLVGEFVDPVVKINQQQISINGRYKGILQIQFNGDIRYFPNADCGQLNGVKAVNLDDICYNCNISHFAVRPCTNTVQVFGANDDGKQLVFIDLMEETY